MTTPKDLKEMLAEQIELAEKQRWEDAFGRLNESPEADAKIQQARQAIWKNKYGKDAPEIKDDDKFDAISEINLRFKVALDAVKKIAKSGLPEKNIEHLYKSVVQELFMFANNVDAIIRKEKRNVSGVANSANAPDADDPTKVTKQGSGRRTGGDTVVDRSQE